MNRITRAAATLALATGLATAALTAAGAAAHADSPPAPNGPGFGLGVSTPEPEPDPEPPAPVPHDGPGTLQGTPHCTHGCGGGGKDGPKDFAPAPQGPGDDGGDGPADPGPDADPADDADLDQGCFSGCDLPEEGSGPVENVAIPAGTAAPGANGVGAAELDSRFGPVDPGTVIADADRSTDAVDRAVWFAAAAALAALFLLALAALRRRRTHEQ